MTSLARNLTPSIYPVALRLFTDIACGWPSPALDYEESPLSLDELLNVTATSTMLVLAEGEAMSPLIEHGDVLVLDGSLDATDGDVVLAVAGGELGVRRIGRVDGRAALIPDNKLMNALIVGDGEDIEVRGVARWRLRCLRQDTGFHSLAAGWAQPDSPYQSLDEMVNVSAYWTFLARARGQSMAPLIRDGDLLIIDRSLDAVAGDVVLAVVAGEFTAKRLGTVGGKPALIPENRGMTPISFDEDEQVMVWGVVRWTLQRLK